MGLNSKNRHVVNMDGTVSYINIWQRENGCLSPPIMDCNWIFTDKELIKFGEWYDKKGEKLDDGQEIKDGG